MLLSQSTVALFLFAYFALANFVPANFIPDNFVPANFVPANSVPANFVLATFVSAYFVSATSSVRKLSSTSVLPAIMPTMRQIFFICCTLGVLLMMSSVVAQDDSINEKNLIETVLHNVPNETSTTLTPSTSTPTTPTRTTPIPASTPLPANASYVKQVVEFAKEYPFYAHVAILILLVLIALNTVLCTCCLGRLFCGKSLAK